MEEGLFGGEDTVVEDAHCGGQGGMGAAMFGWIPTDIARRISLYYKGGNYDLTGAVFSAACPGAGFKKPRK